MLLWFWTKQLIPPGLRETGIVMLGEFPSSILLIGILYWKVIRHIWHFPSLSPAERIAYLDSLDLDAKEDDG